MQPSIKPIPILHLRASNFVGGPEKQILKHGQIINKDLYRFILCPFRENGKISELEMAAHACGLDVAPLTDDPSFSFSTINRLVKIIKRHSIRIVCAHGYKPNIIGKIAGLLTGVRVIPFSRGWTHENRKIRIYEALDRFLLRYSKHIVAVSGGHRDELLKNGLNSEYITVIHNAVEIPDTIVQPEISLRELLSIGDNVPVVVSAGRLSPEKNFSSLIDAASIVLKSYPSAVLAVFGEGVCRSQLEEKIRSMGLQKSFYLPGYRKDFTLLLQQADVFVLPSFTEGFSNVIMEAYAVKRPVIASTVGGNPEIVTDGVTGYLFDPRDVESLSEKISTLLTDRQLSSKMGSSGYLRVKSEYSFERQNQKLEALYQQVISF